MFFALSLSMVLQCDNVFQFGSIGIGPQIITSIFFIAYYLFKNQFKFPIQKENGLQLIGLLLLLLPIFISLNDQNGIRILMLLFYIICSMVVVGVAKYLTYDELYEILYKVSMIPYMVNVYFSKDTYETSSRIEWNNSNKHLVIELFLSYGCLKTLSIMTYHRLNFIYLIASVT